MTTLKLAELIGQLARLGIGLEAEGERLRLVAPEDAIDAELLQAALNHKAALLALLAAGALHREELALIGDWLAETALMLRGDHPDWLQWSAACRVQWARQMLELAHDAGFLAGVPQGVRQWLRHTGATTTRQWASPQNELGGPGP